MVKVIVVNGRPESGKTTFEKLCKKNFPNVHITSTVTFVKDIATICGWNGDKTLKNRKFLSDLKDLLTEWNDVPYKKIKEYVDNLNELEGNHYLFVDCREPKEIDKIKNRLNATTVLVRRYESEKKQVSNHADDDVFNYDYDYTLLNNYSISHLEDAAIKFMQHISGEYNNLIIS